MNKHMLLAAAGLIGFMTMSKAAIEITNLAKQPVDITFGVQGTEGWLSKSFHIDAGGHYVWPEYDACSVSNIDVQKASIDLSSLRDHGQLPP
jgi:hypothetical protein